MSSAMSELSSHLLEKQEAPAAGPSARSHHQAKIPFRPTFVPMPSTGGSYVANDNFGTQHGGGTQQAGLDGNAVFGMSQFSAEQIATLQARLARKLGPEFITQRQGPSGGPKLNYLEGWKAVNLANEVFGFNGWSSSVQSLTVDYLDQDPQSGKVSAGVSCIVRVTLRDGTFHEDVGFGETTNARSKGVALDKVKKEAVTDAVKRTLKNFGNVLGLCLYDKEYTKEVVKIKVQPPKLQRDELWRRPEFDEALQASTSAGPSRPHPLSSDAYNSMPTPGGGRSGIPQPRNVPAPPTPLKSVDDMYDYDSEFIDDGDVSMDALAMPPPPVPIRNPEPAPPEQPAAPAQPAESVKQPPPAQKASPPLAPEPSTTTPPMSAVTKRSEPPVMLGGFVYPESKDPHPKTRSGQIHDPKAARKRAIQEALERHGGLRQPLRDSDENKRPRL